MDAPVASSTRQRFERTAARLSLRQKLESVYANELTDARIPHRGAEGRYVRVRRVAPATEHATVVERRPPTRGVGGAMWKHPIVAGVVCRAADHPGFVTTPWRAVAKWRRHVKAKRKRRSARARTARVVHEAKYGLFIHWGSNAIPAGELEGQAHTGIGEWICTAPGFRCASTSSSHAVQPCQFNADQWVKLAKDAGMKYIVIRRSHHDGFALFSIRRCSSYNVVDRPAVQSVTSSRSWLPPARSRACVSASTTRSTGLARAGGAGNAWDFPPDDEKDKNGAYDSIFATRRSRRCASCSPATGPSR